jgi:pyridoxal 5'-phosphate synthase / NAD(P)H-hydrate epimerase
MMATTTTPSPFLSAADAASLDAELMGPAIGYTLDQLMELAGLACAAALPASGVAPNPNTRVLVLAGPGNNGGDGLVAARHLALWGFSVDVCYPKRPFSSQPHYARLVAQLAAARVPLLDEEDVLAAPSGSDTRPRGLKPGAWSVVVDALLGFGARGPPRPPLDRLIAALSPRADPPPPPVLAVDVPSGWGVDAAGDVSGDGARPAILVSLTAPKPCAARFEGAHHYVGGRFIPPALAEKYGLALPPYPADGAQIVRVGGSGGSILGVGAGETTTAPPPLPSSVAAMRADYGNPAEEAAVPGADLPDPAESADPLSVFEAWFGAASASRVAEEPNAMCLSTVDPATGAPSARFVLMKGFDARGIQFYTNLASRKGRELLGGGDSATSSKSRTPPRAALVFYWEPMRRSVRVEGRVVPVPDAEADAYFASRPRGSQVGAHASRQSQPLLGGRAELEAAVAAAEAAFGSGGEEGGDNPPVPRPPGWGGFIVQPDRWEFWTGRSSRLHDRVVFERAGGEGGEGWRVSRLAP